MNRRTLMIVAGLGALSLTLAPRARAADKLNVVATFSILGDMVRQVGGDRVEVKTLVGPDGDAHVYQPSPADAKAVAQAKILVVNGLGFEGWIARLETSSGFKGKVVTASEGVSPRRAHDAAEASGARAHAHTAEQADPHAWQSLANGRIYATNIRDALIAADPEHRAAYEANTAAFLSKIDALEPELVRVIAGIPDSHRKVITSHDAFGYFAAAYGLALISPEGVSTESEASARDVARIIRQIKAKGIRAVFVENITNQKLLAQISRETGARIGGTLYSDALSGADGPAPTYLEMFRHNTRTLAAALTP